MRNPWIVVPLVASAAIAGGVGTYVLVKRRKQTAALLNEYREALSSYVEALQDGRLDASIIKRLRASLAAVLDGAGDANAVVLDALDKEARMVSTIVKESTSQLALDNGLDLPAIEPPSEALDHAGVIELQRRLEVQCSIFDQAA